jgi:ATP-dependent protease HslVU (ClpYQ) peptidase subunit
MTTIVGIQGDGYALLCADSRIVLSDGEGSGQISTAAAGHSKICSKGKYLMGAAGDVRAINLIQHALSPPQPSANLRGRKLDEFVTVKFIPALRECFEVNGFIPASSDGRPTPADSDADVIIAVNGTIYTIGAGFSWFSEAAGIYAVGTGSAYALAALTATMPKSPNVKQARALALKAINIAAKYDPNTGSPFNTLVQEIPSRTVKTDE